MIYPINSLRQDEAIVLKNAVQQYKDHDRVDLIAELIFSENIKKDIKKRKRKKKINKKEEVRQAMPEAVKFCTSDHCQIDLDNKY